MIEYQYQVELAYEAYLTYARQPVTQCVTSRVAVGDYACIDRLYALDKRVFWRFTTNDDFYYNYEAMFDGKMINSGFYKTNLARYGSVEDTIEILDSMYVYLKESEGCPSRELRRSVSDADAVDEVMAVLALIPAHIPIVVYAADVIAARAVTEAGRSGFAVRTLDDYQRQLDDLGSLIIPVMVRTISNNLLAPYLSEVLIGCPRVLNKVQLDTKGRVQFDDNRLVWTQRLRDWFQRTTGLCMTEEMVQCTTIVSPKVVEAPLSQPIPDAIPSSRPVVESRNFSCSTQVTGELNEDNGVRGSGSACSSLVVSANVNSAETVLTSDQVVSGVPSSAVVKVDFRDDILGDTKHVPRLANINIRGSMRGLRYLQLISYVLMDRLAVILNERNDMKYVQRIWYKECNGYYASVYYIEKKIHRCVHGYNLLVDNPYWCMRHTRVRNLHSRLKIKLLSDYKVDLVAMGPFGKWNNIQINPSFAIYASVRLISDESISIAPQRVIGLYVNRVSRIKIPVSVVFPGRM